MQQSPHCEQLNLRPSLYHACPLFLASLLDSAFGVQVRAGLHCAPLMHQQLGTTPNGGTVRFSVGCFNTTDQIDRAVDAVKEIAGAS